MGERDYALLHGQFGPCPFATGKDLADCNKRLAEIQTTGLSQIERAKIHGAGLDFIDHNCIPIARKILNNQKVVRFRCSPKGWQFVGSSADFTIHVILYSGKIVREPSGFAAFKAHIKKAVLYTAAGVIFAIILYAKASS